METTACPNTKGCQVINIEGYAGSVEQKDRYIRDYCMAGAEKWFGCKRFLVKNALNLCPDFVMPDSTYTLDEILDKLEQE